VSLLGGDREWMGEAICASADQEAWFPPKGSSTREAKRICRGSNGHPGCPVRRECLEYALIHDDRFGVWGGYSERERRKMKPRSS
jgi:WhiB family transcriptional regulator, redox-sensing transcriptional regulator